MPLQDGQQDEQHVYGRRRVHAAVCARPTSAQRGRTRAQTRAAAHPQPRSRRQTRTCTPTCASSAPAAARPRAAETPRRRRCWGVAAAAWRRPCRCSDRSRSARGALRAAPSGTPEPRHAAIHTTGDTGRVRRGALGWGERMVRSIASLPRAREARTCVLTEQTPAQQTVAAVAEPSSCHHSSFVQKSAGSGSSPGASGRGISARSFWARLVRSVGVRASSFFLSAVYAVYRSI